MDAADRHLIAQLTAQRMDYVEAIHHIVAQQQQPNGSPQKAARLERLINAYRIKIQQVGEELHQIASDQPAAHPAPPNCNSRTYSPIEGDGLKDHIVGAYRALTEGARKGATKRFLDFLNTEGTQVIKSLDVVRKPVVRAVQAALNVVSFGAFEKLKKELHYDQLYHNLLLVTLADGSQYTLQKNHVVEHSPTSASENALQRGFIPVPPNTTLKDLIERAAERSDPQRFWVYDASTQNCQHFTQQVAAATGHTSVDPYAVELLAPQNGEALIASLGRLKGLPRSVTDLAGALDRVRFGDGVLKGRGYPQLQACHQILRDYRAGN